MNVHYYEIKNCQLGQSCGRPVIFPPKNTDRELLSRYGFVQIMNTEEWCHFLSNEEYQYIMQFSQQDNVVFVGDKFSATKTEEITDISDRYRNLDDNHNSTANGLAGFSIILMIITVVGSIVSFFEYYEISLFFGFLFIVSVVLAVAVRVIYPENKFGRLLIKIYVALIILFSVILVFAIISCFIAADACIDSCCSELEGCGRIG